MAAPRSQSLSSLTRRHGVKVASAVTVEECCLAAGELVGHEHVLSASRMNSAVVIFLSSIEKANELVETGIVVGDNFTPVLPLSMPSKKVLLSNVPPFVSNETLANIMSRYGKVVSPIKMIPVGCKSPLLKHVVSFRRYLFMILKDDEEIDLSLRLKVEDCDYVIYVTTEKMKCFKCGETTHLIRSCPNKANDDSEKNVNETVKAGLSGVSASEIVITDKNIEDTVSERVSLKSQVVGSVIMAGKNNLANIETHDPSAQTEMQEGDDETNMPQSHQCLDKTETETEKNSIQSPEQKEKTLILLKMQRL
ncbi:hypothetical protein M9458_058200 [Cirrhinus mrigala]|uniref:CCHC-type domain-containing protein n=1 Tax=Cirrhinus mrigala TaxID=683832 RepID=A0ABD0MB48_CIRMR